MLIQPLNFEEKQYEFHMCKYEIYHEHHNYCTDVNKPANKQN